MPVVHGWPSHVAPLCGTGAVEQLRHALVVGRVPDRQVVRRAQRDEQGGVLVRAHRLVDVGLRLVRLVAVVLGVEDDAAAVDATVVVDVLEVRPRPVGEQTEPGQRARRRQAVEQVDLLVGDALLRIPVARGSPPGRARSPLVPLYTPSIRPTPAGGGVLLPGSTARLRGRACCPAVWSPRSRSSWPAVLPAAVVAVLSAVVAVAAAAVVAPPAVAVAAAVVVVALSSLPHAARTNVVVTPTAKAVFHRARRTDPPLVCSARG